MPDLATPATLEDVRGSIERPLTSEEERVIPAWIEQAWIVLRYASPGLEARVVAGSPDELARLAPPAVARGGIFSIQLGRG
jgi:hypothetical protein